MAYRNKGQHNKKPMRSRVINTWPIGFSFASDWLRRCGASSPDRSQNVTHRHKRANQKARQACSRCAWDGKTYKQFLELESRLKYIHPIGIAWWWNVSLWSLLLIHMKIKTLMTFLYLLQGEETGFGINAVQRRSRRTWQTAQRGNWAED